MNRRLWLAWAASLPAAIAWPEQAMAEGDPELVRKLSEALAQNSFKDPYAAHVWLSMMSSRMERYNSDPIERIAILSAVHREAHQVDIKPEMILSVMHVESRFQRFAISSAGAQGLMQIMPFWKDEIGQPSANLFDIDTNIRFGCTILKHYLDRESGNWTRGLARYNGSLGQTWYPERVMRAWDRHWYPA